MLSSLHLVNLHSSTYICTCNAPLFAYLYEATVYPCIICIFTAENIYLILAKSWGLAKTMFALGDFVHLTFCKEVFPLLRQFCVFICVSAYWLPRSGHSLLSPFLRHLHPKAHLAYLSIRYCFFFDLSETGPEIVLSKVKGPLPEHSKL